MGPSRNAPCPCGSGTKYKRCCARRVHERAVAVREETRVAWEGGEWAFGTFGDQLVAAGRALVAELDGAADAVWIFEHWIMLDHELRGGGTAMQRYAALGHLEPGDRAIAERIARARVGLYRVRASRPGDGMDLEDLTGGPEVTVLSASVSRSAQAGDALLARVMDGPPATLWGPSRTFTPRQTGPLVDALARLSAGGRSETEVVRRHWPTLMAYDTRLPEVITSAEWDTDDLDAVLDHLPHALEYDRNEDGADVYLWRIGPRTDEYAATVEIYADGIVAYSYAESTLDALIAMLDDALGPLARFEGRSSASLDDVAPDALRDLAA